jgi:hypothetical protein
VTSDPTRFRQDPAALVTVDLERRLRHRYSGEAYAFMSQVGNATGYGVSRHADALVMSLWPSRGLTLMGFEIKANRGDWMRELKKPGKAEPIARFCDEWWVVAPAEAIVPPTQRTRVHQTSLGITAEEPAPTLDLGHLDAAVFPPTWGLLCPHGKGGLRIVKPAAQLEPKPIDRTFLAAVLRRAAEYMVPKSAIKAEIDAAYQRGLKDGEAERRRLGDVQRMHDEQLKRDLARFEEVSGIKITEYDGPRLGEAVFYLLQARRFGSGLQQHVQSVHDEVTHVQACLAELLAKGHLEGL